MLNHLAISYSLAHLFSFKGYKEGIRPLEKKRGTFGKEKERSFSFRENSAVDAVEMLVATTGRSPSSVGTLSVPSF